MKTLSEIRIEIVQKLPQNRIMYYYLKDLLPFSS